MFSKLKKAQKLILKEIAIYKNVIKDPQTPILPKVLLIITVAYALSPIDLIPDFIPILGYLDDLIILPLLLFVALRFLPKELIEKHRRLLKR